MKTIVTFLFLMTSSVVMFGQGSAKTSIQIGETIRMSLNEYFFNMDIVGSDETGVYGIQMPATEIYGKVSVGGIRNYHLARYNHTTLDNPEVIEMKFKDNDAERDYEFATQVGDQIYVFTSFQNRKLKKTFLFAETVNKQSFGLNKDLKKIAEVDWSNESKYERSSFGFAFSPDKSKLMIRYTLVNKDNEVLRFGICSLDNTFRILWQEDLDIPVKDGTIFNFKKFHIDNLGNVYLLGRLFESEKALEQTNYMQKKTLMSGRRMADREPNYAYQVIAYTNKGKTVSDFVMKEPGKFITDLNLGVDDKQDIILTGFYGTEGMVSVVGAFSMKIKKNSSTITNKIFHAFDKDFIVKGLSDHDAKIVLDGLAAGEEFDKYEYKMEDIKFHDNGTFSMIAEQYIEEIKTIGGGNYSTTELRFYNDNVIIITFAADGTVAWKQKIAKYQYTRHIHHRGYASFALLTNDNKMYFVFNEFPENKPQKSTTVMVQVNADGSIKRETLFSADGEPVVQPSTYKITADKEMYMFGLEGRRDYSVTKLSFN